MVCFFATMCLLDVKEAGRNLGGSSLHYGLPSPPSSLHFLLHWALRPSLLFFI